MTQTITQLYLKLFTRHKFYLQVFQTRHTLQQHGSFLNTAQAVTYVTVADHQSHNEDLQLMTSLFPARSVVA